MNLYDVHAYRDSLHTEFLLAGQIEAPDKHRAALQMYKQLRKIYGDDIQCEIVTMKLKQGVGKNGR